MEGAVIAVSCFFFVSLSTLMETGQFAPKTTKITPDGLETPAGNKTVFCQKTNKKPLHWAEKVKKEVQKLIKQGIIERILANEAAQWISPAGFVAKDKREENSDSSVI